MSAPFVSPHLLSARPQVRFLGVGDGNMSEGSLRCDVNVSVRRKGQTQLGTKARQPSSPLKASRLTGKRAGGDQEHEQLCCNGARDRL